MNATKCAGTTKTGNPCSRNATQGMYCAAHAPADAPARTASGIGDPGTHITVNAIINYIFGGLALALLGLGGLFLMFGATFLADFVRQYNSTAGDIMLQGGVFIGIMSIFTGLVIGVPQVLAGAGLVKRSEGGRVLALIAAALHVLYGLTLFVGNVFALINLAFGGYSFWSLLHPTVVAEFQTRPNPGASA